MYKQSLKNFVCSFLFSLLAVLGVNKVFMHTPKTDNRMPENSAKIQNISLFSTSVETLKPKSSDFQIDVSEIEKLTAPVLSSAPESNQTAAVSIGSLPPPPAETMKNVAVVEGEAALVSISKTAGKEQSKISQAAENDNNVSEQKNIISTDLADAQEIVLEKENVITKLNPSVDYEKSGIVYADISDTFEAETTEPAKAAEIIYMPGDETADTTEEKILVADNNLPATANENNIIEENGIPLTEGDGVLHSHIDVVQNANASQIAMLEPNNLVSTIEEEDFEEEKTLAEADLKQNEWTQMSETLENDSPWVVAKGNKFAKNQAVVEQFAKVEAQEITKTSQEEENVKQKAADAINEAGEEIAAALKPETNAEQDKETKVAYQMMQNLLIPIPEDIMNDTDLTPQLTASPKEKTDDTEKKAEQDAAKKATADESKLNESEKQSGLFKSIASWFSDDESGKQNSTQQSAVKQNSKKKNGIDFFGIVSGRDDNKTATQILPAELRLSFQPNRAEISGQTLRWIHAFADNARDNNNMYIEIRIDGTSSFALQKKRLNLLSTILANRGVDFRKINIVFTSREPNSFIIRNIRFNNNEEVVINKNNNNSYYQPW